MYWTTHLTGGPRRVNHTAVAVDDFIYSFGGFCTDLDYRTYTCIDVHVLNVKTLRWFCIPPKKDENEVELEYPEVPFRRYGHTAVAYKQNIYLWGGRNDDIYCNILFCFDTKTYEWSKPSVSGQMPGIRDGHSACVIDHYMYIFGGFIQQINKFSCDVYCMNLETMDWTYISTIDTPPSYRDFHAATILKNRMYIFGGRGDRNSPYHTQHEVYCSQIVYLDLKTHRWHKPKTIGRVPIGRRSLSIFVHNNDLFIFGGYNGNLDEHFNDLYCFNIEQNVWSSVNPRGVPPEARRRQACIVIDKKMYLFGGTR